MNIIRYVLTTIFLLTFSLTSWAKDKPMVFKGHIKGYTDTTVVFTYQPYELLARLKNENVNIDAKGNFKITLQESSPIRGFFSLGKKPVLEKIQFTKANGQDTSMTQSTFDPKLVYVYLAPGDKLEMSVDTADYQHSLRFKGKYKNDSYLLNAMESSFNNYTEKYLNNYYVYVGYDPESLQRYAENLTDRKRRFIQEYVSTKKTRKHLPQVLLLEAEYKSTSLRINYPALRKQYTKDDTWAAPHGFFTFMDSVSLPAGIHDKGIGYFYFLDNYLKAKYQYKSISKDFYTWVEEELTGYELYEYLAFALGRDFKKALYDRFDENCPYPDLALRVHERYQNILGMLEGCPAPELILEDTTGTKIELASFQGKYVYIDCWATWCGPCIKEIPKLQELEKLFAGQNITFLSLSFDSPKDKQKWKNFVKDYPLHGYQYLLDTDQKKKLSTAFNIQEIPRFILIDPSGNIVDANAPRPSDPKIRPLMEGLLDKSSAKVDITNIHSVQDAVDGHKQELLVLGENHSSSVASHVLPSLLFQWQATEDTVHLFLEFGPSEAYFYQRYIDTGDEKMLNYPLYTSYYRDWWNTWRNLRNTAAKQKKSIIVHGVDFDRCRTFGYALYLLLNKQPQLPPSLSALCDTIRSQEFFVSYSIDFPTQKDSLFIAQTKKCLVEHMAWLETSIPGHSLAVIKEMLDAPQPKSKQGRDLELAEQIAALVKASAAKRPFLLIGRHHAFMKVPYLPEKTSALAYLRQRDNLAVRTLVVLHEQSAQWNATYDDAITIFDVSQKEPWKPYAQALLTVAAKNPFTIIPLNDRFGDLKDYADYILIAQNQPAIRIWRK